VEEYCALNVAQFEMIFQSFQQRVEFAKYAMNITYGRFQKKILTEKSSSLINILEDDHKDSKAKGKKKNEDLHLNMKTVASPITYQSGVKETPGRTPRETPRALSPEKAGKMITPRLSPRTKATCNPLVTQYDTDSDDDTDVNVPAAIRYCYDMEDLLVRLSLPGETQDIVDLVRAKLKLTLNCLGEKSVNEDFSDHKDQPLVPMRLKKKNSKPDLKEKYPVL